VRELSRRAALDFLRDRAADVLAAGKNTALVCRLVARTALGVGRRDLVLTARELLQEVEPSTENRLEFAAELARAADPERASRALAEASQDRAHPPRPPRSPPFKPQLRRRASSRGQPLPVISPRGCTGPSLAAPRASERGARAARARSRCRQTHLGLAAALAETWIELPSCPDLPPDVGTPGLCAESFLTSERVRAATGLLDAAWASAAGRDDEAVEVYTALGTSFLGCTARRSRSATLRRAPRRPPSAWPDFKPKSRTS